jgi:hypothetical protein
MPYTAVLRWKGPDPALELETRHAGFAIPEEAALFANSFAENSPERLKLGRTGLRLFSVDGTSTSLTFELVTAWIAEIPEEESDVLIIDDSDFQPFLGSQARLPERHTAYGNYEIAQFAVLGPDAKPIQVSVSMDDEEHLRVTVEEIFEEPSEEEATSMIGSLPKA